MGEDGLRPSTPTLQHPRCVYQLMKTALCALHAGDGVAHHRRAAGQVPEGLRLDRRDGGAGQGDDQHVRAGLDAALQGLAEHPHHGDDPAAAGQYRRRRRRHERAARPFQHPGADRPRPDEQPAARLHDAADRTRKWTRDDLSVDARHSSRCGPNQISYWQNYPKFFTSFQKAMYGAAATAENDYAYDWLPKLDVTYDILRAFELMHQGKINGYFCQGFNPLMSFPNKEKIVGRAVEAEVPGHDGPAGDGDRRASGRITASSTTSTRPSIQTEVFRLPTTCFAEETGSLTNSGRWLQWHWKGAEPPGEAKTDVEIMAKLYLQGEGALRRGGRHVPRADRQSASGPTRSPTSRTPRRSPRRSTATRSRMWPMRRPDEGRAARRASRWTASPSCATTARPPADAGSIPAATPRRATRWRGATMPIPRNAGLAPNWAWSWPANRRILYNRASCDTRRATLQPEARDGRMERRRGGAASMCPDFPVTSHALGGRRAVHHEPGRRRRGCLPAT